MDRIPVEIFCNIFILSIIRDRPHYDEDSEDEPDISEGRTWPSVFDFRRGPWSVSGVCRKWRMISTCFPRLWSCFIFSGNDLDLNKDGKVALDSWLTFSGTSKLSILIEPDGICNVSRRVGLFQTLTRHAERWERIEFVNSTPSFWSMLNAQDLNSRLCSLKRVTFLSGDTTLEPDAVSSHPLLYHAFLHAPQLHSLINRDHFPLYKLPMPWTQLTEYEGSSQTHLAVHFRILRLMPNLEKCQLEIAYADHSDRTSFLSPLLLPKLQLLQIRTAWFADGINELPRFIHLLRLPALRILSIISEHLTSVPPPFRAFAEVLKSSGSPCKVRQLELIVSCQIEPLVQSDHILDLLRATPDLRYLCITAGASPGARVLQETIIPHLQIESGLERALIPMLNTLELKFPLPTAVHILDLSMLAAGIRSRWTALGPQSIQNLIIDIDLEEDWVGDESFLMSSNCWPPIMEVLQEEGLNIVVHTTRSACVV